MPAFHPWRVQGRAKEAMQLLQAAVTIAPGYAEAWNNLGVLQRDVGLVPVRPSSADPPQHRRGVRPGWLCSPMP